MINLIAAVGRHGEIGCQGKIPWLDDPHIVNTVKEDLGWFAEQTKDDILLVGLKTFEEMKSMGFQKGDRDVLVWNGKDEPKGVIDYLERTHPNKDIWICGGAWTYQNFLPYVQRFYISRIPWTGPADRFMPPLLPTWGYVGGPVHKPYECPVCRSNDRNSYLRCNRPDCPGGRDPR